MPFYEPGLEELVGRHLQSGRLGLSTHPSEGLAGARVVFLAVGTPATPNGEADLSQIIAAVQSLLPHLEGRVVLATKSTVPVGTGALIEGMLAERAPSAEVDVVSNPEFLREGAAISDFMRPDRVVIGTRSERAARVMRDIYRPLYLIETPLVFTTVETAEMIKYASNAFLAVKISFINEVANLCDEAGADVHVVAKAMGLDKRIGSKFLHPGPGYGGSCFPKDTRALVALGTRHGVPMEVVSAAIRANQRQRKLTIERVVKAAGGIDGKNVCVLGLAFKPNTSDVRESPAWEICVALAAQGARVRAFDPAATAEARRLAQPAGRSIEFAADAYDAAAQADVVVVATEWNEFRALDLERLKSLVRTPAIVDARNVFDPERVRAAGFAYVSTGRGSFASDTDQASLQRPLVAERAV
jgi:UDPglucose 6-dehydrogenase